MTDRIQRLTVRPWVGGLNTSMEAALINNDETTETENIIFTPEFSQRTRGGFKYWDYIAIGVQRSSSGTVRTIRVEINDGFTLSTGSSISVFHKDDDDISDDYDTGKISIDSITLVSGSIYDITYELSTSLTESTVEDTLLRVGLLHTSAIIGVKDFWYYSDGKQQKRIAVRGDGTFWEYTEDGSQSQISTTDVTLPTKPIANCDFAVLGERLVISFEGDGNYPVIWDGTSDIEHISNIDFDGDDISSINPVPEILWMIVYQSRIFATDKNDPDKLHYCDVNEPRRWNGEGDSGAMITASGDGDSTGFAGVLPPYKGLLSIAKQDKLYHVQGEIPLSKIVEISNGIGIASHKSAVAIDHDDIIWASLKGFHAMSATDKYGDTEGTFLSSKIQPTFNKLDSDGLEYIDGIYLSELNSVLWIVRGASQGAANIVLVYNILSQSWYKWISDNDDFLLSCISLVKKEKDKQVLTGTYNGRILLYDENSSVDMSNTPIYTKVKTGIIYPDNDPTMTKGFKILGLLYKTEGNAVSISVTIKIDNYTEQTYTIDQTEVADYLGTTFTLGSSTLGYEEILLPEFLSIDGYGYGMSLELSSSSPFIVYGYIVGFEPAGDQLEVIR